MSEREKSAHWTTTGDIAATAEKLWSGGRLPSALITGEELFPYSIKLSGPKASEMADNIAEIRAWCAALEARSLSERRRSYRLEYRSVRNGVLGKNSIPCRAVIETVEDALTLAGRKKDAEILQRVTKETVDRLPALVGYIYKKPLTVLEHSEDWGKFICVCEWMLLHTRPGVYIREMDVRGVHTKFVETHKKILGELLDILLPPETIDNNYTAGANFEKRYGFKAKDAVVRMRLPKNCSLFPAAACDISLTGEEFAAVEIPCCEVLIVENQITFLALPQMPGLLLVLGLGYGFDALKKALWLEKKKVFYWGDIDTHGFEILSELRNVLPKARSLLMDAETFGEYRDLCVEEPSPFRYIPERLTDDETSLFIQLHAENGKNLRLEQERVGMTFAVRKLCAALRQE